MEARAESPAVAVKPDGTPPARGSALAAVDEAWVERTLRSLSPREKAGQLVLAWISGRYAGPGDEEMGRASTWVRRDHVGGFIISNGTPPELIAKLNALQGQARVPLLMVSDLESGPGMRLLGSGTDFPPVMGLAAAGSDSLAFAVGKVIGEEGRAVGLHLTLSPVLDVNSNPRNPIINTRSFGEDPASVGRFAADYVRGVHAGGLLAMGKHFPGHGDTHADSHMELPSVDAARARLDAVDLPPFRAAIAAGMDGMLVGHIAVPNVAGDDVPSSISPKVTGAILRGEMGFRGLVSTDAFNMRGLTRRYGQGDAAAVAARADDRRGAGLGARPRARPAALVRRHRDRDLRAVDRLLERDRDLGLEVAAALGARARRRAATARTAAGLAEQVGDDVAEAAGVEARLPAAAAPDVRERVGERAVVLLALLRVAEDVVCLRDRLEALLGLRVTRVLVGVVLARELAVRLLDLVLARLAADAEHLVMILGGHLDQCSTSSPRSPAQAAGSPR